MAIIISKKGSQAAQIVDPTDFEREHNLQEYIHEHPESIPVYEINKDKKLLVVAREFETESGPIDALAIDKDGDIYLVETKLHRNTDKRTIVAQILDYGASLWKHMPEFAEFLDQLDEAVRKKWKIGFQDKTRQFFSLDDSQLDLLRDNMRSNLREGSLKFVILMDAIDERLKDLITYVNQNSKFDIFAVQLEYYKHEEYEIMIPKLFGAEVTKIITPNRSDRRKWDQEKMFADAREKLDRGQFDAFEKIYRFAAANTDDIHYGTGAYGSFSPIFHSLSDGSLFTLGTDKCLSFNFDWVARDNEQTANAFKEMLDQLGFKLPKGWKTSRPSVGASEWCPKTDAFLKSMQALLSTHHK